MAASGRDRLVLKRCAWLADGVMLAVARVGEEQTADAALEMNAAELLAGPLDAGDGERVLVAQAPAAVERGGGLRVDGAGCTLSAAGTVAREALTDLHGLLREELAGRDRGTRDRVVAMLASLAGREDLPLPLADGLVTVRDALRERLALAVVDERVERVVHVDALHRVAADEFYVRGWAWDRAGTPVALSAVSPAGERVELLERAFRFPQADAAERVGAGAEEPLGFACHFRSSVRSASVDGWIFELASEEGRGVETAAALSSTDPAEARRALVADACANWPGAEALRENHLRPALTRMQEGRRDAVHVARVETHGEMPAHPEVSVVVPLYRRVDLVEHQIVQFADDPELRECEIVYVLDSPDQAEQLDLLARELAGLYDVPFRTAVLSGNGGVALARNLGASLASGRRLLFLDSDVMPVRPGWVGGLTRALGSHPSAGAVGPKLVYHDGAVQHAGIVFERAGDGAELSLEHRLRGVHRDMPAANAGGPVPALTGACLMTDAALYREVDGMSWMYVQGDYEDADFCLRLARRGRECLYVPEVILDHLEAQSYPPEARVASRRWNRWLFSRLWGDAIEAGAA